MAWRRKHRRLAIIGLAALGVGTAAALTLTAFEDNVLFFYSPTDIAQRAIGPDQRFRLGGMVAEDSIAPLEGAGIAFVVTDTAHDVTVRYAGLLPDLFREGQGVVANGRLTAEGVFVAEEVLARHDESYMPPEAAEALARAGEGPLTAPRASGNDAARPPGVYGQDSLATQGSSQ